MGLPGDRGHGLAHVKGNSVVLLIYSCVDFCSLYAENWRSIMTNGAARRRMSSAKTMEPSSQLLRMMDVQNCGCFNFLLQSETTHVVDICSQPMVGR